MKIKRLRVEEGFFDGLELEFDDGLNVLIGGRGVGKTSVIELLRFGLGVPGLTQKSDEEALAHALAVLQSGRVTIDLEVDGEDISVIRAADADAPLYVSDFPKPIVFSQTEIESVGLNAHGRLRLIDSFIPKYGSLGDEITVQHAAIRSKAAAMAALRREIDELNSKGSDLESLKKEEADLQTQQAKFATENASVEKAQKQLSVLQETLNKFAVDQQNLSAFINVLSARRRYVAELTTPVSMPRVSTDDVRPLVDKLERELEADQATLASILKKGEQYEVDGRRILQVIAEKRVPVEEAARVLRGQVERYKEGAGQVSRQMGKVQESIARTSNIRDMASKRTEQLAKLYKECTDHLERVSVLRHQVFERRKETAATLNSRLADVIRVEVQHLARLDEYEQALKDTLKGSGLRYNEVASIVASRVSPQELLMFVHQEGYDDFAEALDIPSDRAARLLGYLKETDLGEILTASIEDDVQLMLLDGASYKQIDELSIGQRCTVALSLVLENRSQILLVDQPEDHLDNEFVAETLIRALRERSLNAQSIVSSHNANIPVLGDAARVIHLDSNGRKGFVRSSDKLDAPEIVLAIETIMEGGKEAFKKRAKFYASSSRK